MKIPLNSNVTCYLVGGAVRDTILGLIPRDIDYVVVGGSHEYMISNGLREVGLGFPVYLHPETNNEYALARIEKKTGSGYNGFDCVTENVTIEADLSRRDFTMNAMAIDQDGNLIDPYGGSHDLAQGIIRHTSDAFSEDPLRVLRAARFAARYDFKVANDTTDLCREIVKSGVLNEIDDNRFWKELEKVIYEKYPLNFFYFLYDIGAFTHCNFLNTLFSSTPIESSLLKAFSFAASYKDVTGYDLDRNVLIALICHTDPNHEKLASILSPSEVISLVKFQDDIRFLYDDLEEYTDFSIKWRFHHKTNASLKNIEIYMRALRYCDIIDFKSVEILTWCIRNFSAFDIEIPPKIVGKEIGEYKRKVFRDRLKAEFRLTDHKFDVQ